MCRGDRGRREEKRYEDIERDRGEDSEKENEWKGRKVILYCGEEVMMDYIYRDLDCV